MCRSEGLHFLFCVGRLTEYGSLCYNGSAIERRQVVPPGFYIENPKGGDNMTILEVLALLNLLVVVIFGIIDIMMKKK